jgi:hypothetical protein
MKELAEKYLRLIAELVNRLSERASKPEQAQLAKARQWFDSWSKDLDEQTSPAADLEMRHGTIHSLLHAVIESLEESGEDREFLRDVQSKLDTALRMCERLAHPSVPRQRMLRVPVSSSNERAPDPIFVVSSWRSGSSLLMALLDAHENLTALPENNLLDPFLSIAADRRSNLVPLLYKNRPMIINVFNATMSFGLAEREFYQRFALFIDSMVAPFVQARGGRRWVCKEIVNTDSLDLIDLAFGHRARFVWLVRHGLDVVNSHVERYERRGAQCADLSVYATEWVLRNTIFADFHERTPDRCTRVRYEDLVADPDAELRRIVDFIGEPWDEGLLSRMAAATSGVLGGDHKIASTGGKIDASRIGMWAEWPPIYIRQIGSIVNPMLERLGYDRVS